MDMDMGGDLEGVSPAYSALIEVPFGRPQSLTRNHKLLTRLSREGTMTIAAKYAKMPKVELHCHADGACRLETLRDLARKYGIQDLEGGTPLPYDDLEKFKEYISLPRGAASLADFLKVFRYLDQILRTREALERIAYEFCEDCKLHNILYAEYRYNSFPISDVAGTPSGADYCEAIITGLERGQKEFGVKVRSIFCFMRERPERVMDTLKLAQQFQSRGVVGVDIAGNELLPLDQLHVDGFRRAKELGLKVTVHAGESGPAENVKIAIEKLGAERIGHGYHTIDDDDVYRLARERGIHFEVCPTSSAATKSATLDDHAVRRFAQDGVSFSINTDDQGVLLCTLTHEFGVAERDIGLTKDQLMQSVHHAAQASFLPADEKAQLIEEVKQQMAVFASESGTS